MVLVICSPGVTWLSEVCRVTRWHHRSHVEAVLRPLAPQPPRLESRTRPRPPQRGRARGARGRPPRRFGSSSAPGLPARRAPGRGLGECPAPGTTILCPWPCPFPPRRGVQPGGQRERPGPEGAAWAPAGGRRGPAAPGAGCGGTGRPRAGQAERGRPGAPPLAPPCNRSRGRGRAAPPPSGNPFGRSGGGGGRRGVSGP